MKKIRLFIEEKNLNLDLQIKVFGSDFEYLTKVMRQKIGDEILVFNGVDGEFVAKIFALEKKFLHAKIIEKKSDLKKVANITLAFAPVKNARIDFIAAKATELGVASFQAIFTNRTIVDKINFERFKANIKEACEQCERNDFPQILPPKKLIKFLSESEAKNKIFILCDESHGGKKASEVLQKINVNKKSEQKSEEKVEQKEIVILVGPEGGFCPEEFEKMRALKNIFAISLGPRILRSDTAIISAITLVQEFLGDF